MRFARIDNSINVCKGLLKANSSVELETYLVSYLLVTTYAEYEEMLQRIIHARVARLTDEQLHRFIKSYLTKKTGESRFGRIGIGDLGGILGKFGTSCKNAFCTEITDKPPHQSWDLIVSNRHSIAHPGSQLQMTFREFQEAYRHSQVVLAAFARACGLTAGDIASL